MAPEDDNTINFLRLLSLRHHKRKPTKKKHAGAVYANIYHELDNHLPRIETMYLLHALPLMYSNETLVINFNTLSTTKANRGWHEILDCERRVHMNNTSH